MSSLHPRRCSRHDLAAAPDGQCIVCRRELIPAFGSDTDAGTSSTIARVLGVVLLVCLAGAAAAWTLLEAWPSPPLAAKDIGRGRGMAELRRAVSPEDAAKAAAVVALREEQAQLNASLRMLARAETERLALERANAERYEQQRLNAEAKRKQEELARDRERHEVIQRDLASVALTAARSKVSITMYSTSWCGVCKQARAYMRRNSIAFTELDIDHDAPARVRARELNPHGSVPTIAVDDELLIGFSPGSLETKITRAARRRSGT